MIDRRAALKAERAAVLDFCESLGPADWRINSRAPGWSITDVVAHMGGGCRALFTPAALTIMRTNDIEAANDAMVDRGRDRPPVEVLREYRRWSGVYAGSLMVLARGPLARVQIPLGELGRFPMRLTASAMVFDHHTHLRHDMAPALDCPAPGTDANRMAAVLEWMTAVLANQLRAADPAWLDRPIALTLTGPGGGSWLIEPGGVLTAGRTEPAAAHITAVALEFPEWGTRRAPWRERDVAIAGDADYGATFLDAVNVV